MTSFSSGNIEQIAASTETSEEIIEAIIGMDIADPSRVWDSPSDEELLSIWGTVTKNGLIHSTDFVWGAAGEFWADEK